MEPENSASEAKIPPDRSPCLAQEGKESAPMGSASVPLSLQPYGDREIIINKVQSNL